MAGPYCKDCKHFEKWIWSEDGECRDPSKRISSKYGGYKDERPSVQSTDGCSNWTPIPDTAKPPNDGAMPRRQTKK